MTGGEAMGLAWDRAYTLTAEANPAFGNGEACLRLGRTGSILVGIDYQPVPCTVEQGTTVLVWGITNTCSDVEPDPFFAVGRAAQRRCAMRELAPFVASVALIVDGGRSIDLQRRRFETFSPLREVQVPAGLDIQAGPGSFTAWGWVAWLKHLPPGRHTIRTVTRWTDGSEPHVISLVVNVVGHHAAA